MSTNLTNKEIRVNAKVALTGITASVVNASNELLSPFSVCNQLKKEKGEEFTAFLEFFGLSRKAFGFNAETFGDHYVAVDNNTHVLVYGVVDSVDVSKAQSDYENALETFEVSDKGVEAKKALRKAKTAYNKVFANLDKINDTYYHVLSNTISDYKKLLKQMVYEQKMFLLENSEETRKKAEKAKERALAKAAKDAKKAEKEKSDMINAFKFVVISEHPEFSQGEINEAATQMYNNLVSKQMKIA